MQNCAPGEAYEEILPDSKLQCSLDAEAEFDPMDADQPRITDEELKQAEGINVTYIKLFAADFLVKVFNIYFKYWSINLNYKF